MNTELFEKNMAAFKKALPEIHYRLSQITETQSKLIFDEDGNPDIEFRGQTVYGEPLETYNKKSIKYHYDNPTRLFLSPPQSSNMDTVGQDFNFRVLKRAVEEENIQFGTEPANEESHFFIVMGVGLGQHLMELAKRSNAIGFIMIEPNIEFLYHSLYITEWDEIFSHFRGPEIGRYCNLFIESNPFDLNQLIISAMRGINPSFCDGTQIYTHYLSAIFEETRRSFMKDANMVVTGLGFYVDEEIMIRNSYNNLKKYNKHVFQDSKRKLDLPVFVIGSGPSLENNIDYIRENQDNAIIVTGGTSLRPLLKAGIKSDFHVEVENVEATFTVLEYLASEFDVSDITLVTTTTMQPAAIELFDKTVLYFRQSLSSNPIFSLGQEYQLLEVSPTVTNAALSFAQQIGGHELYFFGMDYGTRELGRQHIKGTAYDDKVPFSRKFNKPYRGNFGGTVYTENILSWARNVAERSIRRFQNGHIYYNCSDGCYIERAIPRIPKSLKPLKPINKRESVEKIFDHFPVYSNEIFQESWGKTDWKQQVLDLLDRILSILDAVPDKDKDGEYWSRYIERIARVLVDKDHKTTPAMYMMRGSIFLMFMTAVYYPPRTIGEDAREKAEEIIKDEMKKMIVELREKVETFYDELTTNDTETDKQ
jgi:hypothetical protein